MPRPQYAHRMEIPQFAAVPVLEAPSDGVDARRTHDLAANHGTDLDAPRALRASGKLVRKPSLVKRVLVRVAQQVVGLRVRDLEDVKALAGIRHLGAPEQARVAVLEDDVPPVPHGPPLPRAAPSRNRGHLPPGACPWRFGFIIGQQNRGQGAPWHRANRRARVRRASASSGLRTVTCAPRR